MPTIELTNEELGYITGALGRISSDGKLKERIDGFKLYERLVAECHVSMTALTVNLEAYSALRFSPVGAV